jgi:hypothetical protein
LLEQAIDPPPVVAALGRELLHVLDHRGEGGRDRGATLGEFLLLGLALCLLARAARIVVRLAPIALLPASLLGLSLPGEPRRIVVGFDTCSRGDTLAGGCLRSFGSRALGGSTLLLALCLALDRAQLIGGAGLSTFPC